MRDPLKLHSSLLSLLALVSIACTADTGAVVLDGNDYAAESARSVDDSIRIEKVRLNDLTFTVRTAGPARGEVVILLHGFPETSYEWRHQIPALARAGYRVLAPDLRGYSEGARPTKVEDYSLLSYVADVLALADHAGALRFHLVGHDVGGLVAWGTAQLAGYRLKSLTALSVPHPGAFAAELADPNSCQSEASSWYETLIPPDAAAKLLDDPDSLLRQTWAEFDADATAEYLSALGEPAKLDGALNTWRANFIDGQPQLALPIPVFVPTLFVWGSQDPYNCRDAEPATRRLTWSAYQFEVFEGIGHWIPEDAPDEFNGLLLRHLRRNR